MSTLGGFRLNDSLPLKLITAFNLLHWIYFTGKLYQATAKGVKLSSQLEAVKYYVMANPLTQLIYLMIWVVPISLAVWDYVGGGSRHTDFHVTPKQIEMIRWLHPTKPNHPVRIR